MFIISSVKISELLPQGSRGPSPVQVEQFERWTNGYSVVALYHCAMVKRELNEKGDAVNFTFRSTF